MRVPLRITRALLSTTFGRVTHTSFRIFRKSCKRFLSSCTILIDTHFCIFPYLQWISFNRFELLEILRCMHGVEMRERPVSSKLGPATVGVNMTKCGRPCDLRKPSLKSSLHNHHYQHLYTPPLS